MRSTSIPALLSCVLLLFLSFTFAEPDAAQLEARKTDNDGCKASDIKIIKRQIVKVEPFCRWFLFVERNRSPLKGIGPKALTKACRCLYPRAAEFLNRPYPRGSGKVYSSECNRDALRKVEAQYREPVKFCEFYVALNRTNEPGRAVPGITKVRTVQQACACQPSNAKPGKPATTPKKSSSSTTRTSTGTSSSTSLSSTVELSAPATATALVRDGGAPTNTTFRKFYSGVPATFSGVTYTTNITFPLSMNPFRAVQECATITYQSGDNTFVVFASKTEGQWSCNSYPDVYNNTSDFTPANTSEVADTYGYVSNGPKFAPDVPSSLNQASNVNPLAPFKNFYSGLVKVIVDTSEHKAFSRVPITVPATPEQAVTSCAFSAANANAATFMATQTANTSSGIYWTCSLYTQNSPQESWFNFAASNVGDVYGYTTGVLTADPVDATITVAGPSGTGDVAYASAVAKVALRINDTAHAFAAQDNVDGDSSPSVAVNACVKWAATAGPGKASGYPQVAVYYQKSPPSWYCKAYTQAVFDASWYNATDPTIGDSYAYILSQ